MLCTVSLAAVTATRRAGFRPSRTPPPGRHPSVVRAAVLCTFLGCSRLASAHQQRDCAMAATGKQDYYRADGVRITHDPYAPEMIEKYGRPGETDNEVRRRRTQYTSAHTNDTFPSLQAPTAACACRRVVLSL